MGCQGSKITEEAYAPPSSHMIVKKREFLQSMVLEDVRGGFRRGKKISTSIETAPTEETGIECMTIESDKDKEVMRQQKVNLRQQKAYQIHLERESSVTRTAYTPQRVRSWNTTDAY